MTATEAPAKTNAIAEAPEKPQTFTSKLLMLTWVFAAMSLLGLAGETLQHYIAFNGDVESRAGLLWGPFSPIYGTGAFLLTVFALRLDGAKFHSTFSIFCIAAVVGGAVEYLASWAMEEFWGIVAWSYLEAPGNFNGRTDIFHMVIWGILGLVWVRLGYPFVKKIFAKVNTEGLAYRIVTWALFAFLMVDIVMTVAVMLRADARCHGVEATTPHRNCLRYLLS